MTETTALDHRHDRDLPRGRIADPSAGDPTQSEQLAILLAVLDRVFAPGTAIVELGAGSGRVVDLILRRVPAARVVGVDPSPSALELAKLRIGPARSGVTWVEGDLRQPRALALPEDHYSVVLAVHTLHDLTAKARRATFALAYRTLEPGGHLLIADRVAVPSAEIYPAVAAVRECVAASRNGGRPASAALQDRVADEAQAGGGTVTLSQELA